MKKRNLIVCVLAAAAVFFTAGTMLGSRTGEMPGIPVLNPARTAESTETGAEGTALPGQSGESGTREEPNSAAASSFAQVADIQANAEPEETEPSVKIIYLTFDDGPSPRTPEVLDILDRYGVKATFFVIHSNEENREYMKRAYESGHAIGLHTYSHKYSAIYASETAFFDDLQKISDEVFDCIGERACIMRFAGGSSNTMWKKYGSAGLMEKLVKGVGERGFAYFDWNAQNNDSAGGNQTAESMYNSAVAPGKNGKTPVNLLMHDEGSKKLTVSILAEVIEFYQNKGYEFHVLTKESPVFHHSLSK